MRSRLRLVLSNVKHSKKSVLEPNQDELPVTKHARRASLAGAGRFAGQSGGVPLSPDSRADGSHIFRRLSLRGPSTFQACS